MNPLLDSNFLVKLNNDRNRTIYAHVISLNQYEHPIEQLEGVVTAGSITIDGQSAVRRICSLTLSAKNLNINNVYWGLTTKVKIEIGLQNNVDSRYDDIIWFPQGIFILTDFKTTQTVNNYTINLTGKDKMCLLNGDVSGNLPAPVRFDSYTDASKQAYDIPASGFYNNFIDDTAAAAILAGFQERYGSDYQFIRGAKKILSLQYIPKDQVQGSIKFSQTDDFVPLSSLVLKNTDNKTYDITIDDNSIYGFIVEGCNKDDRFVWTIEQKIPIAIIIQEMLHQFGQERYSNIIIRDIDPYALEMLDSAFTDSNHYLLHNGDIYCKFINQTELKNDYVIYGTNEDIKEQEGLISNLIFRNYIDEDDVSLINIIADTTMEKEVKKPTQIIKRGEPEIKYTVQPIYNGETAGYGMTLLVYPDELIGQPGDSITSILDKIVNMMGDYEYFYDLNGQFVFQAKPAYVKTAWNKRISFDTENYIDASELANRVAYTFDDSALTTQYQNTPNMNNIKNDYIIWGERKSLSGNSIKFHGRYAIENIPLEYTDFNGYTWTSNRAQSLIQAIYNKKKDAIDKYQHIYEYPNNYMPESEENGGWWEINDWANYYQSVFGIDLSVSSNWMKDYHPPYDQAVKQEALEIFKQGYLKDFPGSDGPGGAYTTDVITIIYTDKTKTKIQNVYSHGTCSHYYSQFMDLRLLDQGWDYANNPVNQYYAMYNIINTVDPSRRYIVGDNRSVTWGYHPDYTTSFIFRPVLPDDLTIYGSDIISGLIYEDAENLSGQKRKYALTEDVDWRHLIHVMADDWYQHHTEDDYEINLRQHNCWPDLNINLYPYGRTGYEQYYLDFTSIGGFWQDLYNINLIKYNYFQTHPDVQDESWDLLQTLFDEEKCRVYKFGNVNTSVNINISSYQKNEFNDNYNIVLQVNTVDSKKALQNELSYLKDYILDQTWENNSDGEAEYYLLICTISKRILNDNIINNTHISALIDIINNNVQIGNYIIDPGKTYGAITIFNNQKNYYPGGAYKYWHRNVIENPEKLTFWFDFFQADEMGIGKFATSVIGDRPKTINDSAIKTIIYRDTPDVIYCSWNEYETYKNMRVLKDGYKYIIIGENSAYLADDIDKILSGNNEDEKNALKNKLASLPLNIKQNFVRSIRGKTVHDQADNMLYQYSYYNDTVNINSVPIYYLQPNTIISTKDELSRVTGYYVMNKINISLAYNGTMQITAIKSPERIY